MVIARSARMGTNTLAVAVLLQTFVMITAIPVKMRLATQPGKVERFSLRQASLECRSRGLIMLYSLSCFTSMRESPEVWRHLARVKPPPRRKRTPQHILVSISRQESEPGV